MPSWMSHSNTTTNPQSRALNVFFFFIVLQRKSVAVGFSSGPPETDHLTPVKESAHCPRRDGVKTGQSAGTGRTGRLHLPWTKQGAGIERDPCPMSEIDAPALRNESPGRYEQDGMPPKSLIWIYHLIKRTWRDVCLLVWLCVSALYVHSCTLAGGEWWGNNFSGGGKENMQTNFYRTALWC